MPWGSYMREFSASMFSWVLWNVTMNSARIEMRWDGSSSDMRGQHIIALFHISKINIITKLEPIFWVPPGLGEYLPNPHSPCQPPCLFTNRRISRQPIELQCCGKAHSIAISKAFSEKCSQIWPKVTVLASRLAFLRKRFLYHNFWLQTCVTLILPASRLSRASNEL